MYIYVYVYTHVFVLTLYIQPSVVTVKLVEFDHLISKAKLTDEDAFEDFLNPVTRYEVYIHINVCVYNNVYII